jgi:hypothetical protein
MAKTALTEIPEITLTGKNLKSLITIDNIEADEYIFGGSTSFFRTANPSCKALYAGDEEITKVYTAPHSVINVTATHSLTIYKCLIPVTINVEGSLNLNDGQIPIEINMSPKAVLDVTYASLG